MTRSRWSVLGFLAGDNDLEGAAIADIKEMERVGSRPGELEIVVQVDRAADHSFPKDDWQNTRRYYITRSTHRDRITSRLLADLGETNTGDPRVLEEFLDFAVSSFPSEATALIIWNHGSGVFVPAELLAHHGAPSRREIVNRASPRLRRTVFHTSREALVQLDPQRRGIAYDDRSGDCLDNRELQRVLGSAHELLGRPVDLVGMDACLMTMIEVAYQIRTHARVLVGSEEVEPGDGWPYAEVLSDLAARPAMTAEELGGAIVHRYVASYAGFPGDVTQAAIDLSRLEPLVDAVDRLARALLEHLTRPRFGATIYTAWRSSLRFFDNYYVDLHSFASALAAATNVDAVRRASVEVQRAIEGKGVDSPIIAEAHAGPGMDAARGLSIYFPPFRVPSPFYAELDFARRTRWADFLDAYLRKGN
jgi:hypothetical protein